MDRITSEQPSTTPLSSVDVGNSQDSNDVISVGIAMASIVLPLVVQIAVVYYIGEKVIPLFSRDLSQDEEVNCKQVNY